MSKSTKNKQYMFNFCGGGWNTVWAKSLPGARKAVLLEYVGGVEVPNVKTVRLANDKSIADCMATFY